MVASQLCGYCWLAAAVALMASYIWMDVALVVSLTPASGAVFTLPSPLIRTIRSQLCSSTLYIQTVHWGIEGGDPRPRFISSTVLLGNLTTLELFTRCNGALRKVSPTRYEASCFILS